MSSPTLKQVQEAMESAGYKIFDNPSGYDLNLVGIRTYDNRANTFNDWLTVFYKLEDNWIYFAFPATTDPGIYYRKNPMNVRGTAVMKPGQYRGAYMIGKHKGYRVLQQKGPITVFRDANQNETIDTTGTAEDTGLHAVNIHRANAHHASTQVGKWSAGCQVVQDPAHFVFLMDLCARASEKYGNSFTYTLLTELELDLPF